MAKPPSPPDPGELDVMMISMHEVYMSATRAGFNPSQAMELVKEMMATGLAEGMRGTQEPE